jgi:single-strand DNA-binding protein
MGTNVVVLVGNMTRDVEVRYIASGTAVADAGLAVNRRVKGEDKVDFFDITFWGKTAEIAAEYAKKGKQVAITGRLETQRWEKEGQKHSKTVVVCENLQLVGSVGKKNDSERGSGETFESKTQEEVPY